MSQDEKSFKDLRDSRDETLTRSRTPEVFPASQWLQRLIGA